MKDAAERFKALGDLVQHLHDGVKEGELGVDDIVDRFYRVIGLGKAFQADCDTYINATRFSEADPNVVMLMNNIQIGLACTMHHLEQAALEAKTNILAVLMSEACRTQQDESGRIVN